MRIFDYLTNKFFDFLRSGQKIRTEGTLILGFHGLVDNIIDPQIQLNHITTSNFKSLLEEIIKYREVIPYSQLSECLEQNKILPQGKVVLTFDDGYESNLKIAAPILAKMGLPWSVFVPTNYIDTGERLPTYILRAAILKTNKKKFEHSTIGTLPILNTKDKMNAITLLKNIIKSSSLELVNSLVSSLKTLMSDKEWEETNKLFISEKLLNWEQLNLLVKSGVHVGSHCHNHAILHEKQPSEIIKFELEKSKSLLKEKLDINCFDLVYPNGSVKDISNKAIRLVSDSGYKTASTLIPGFCFNGVDPLYLPRYYISNDPKDNMNRLRRSRSDNKKFYQIY